MGGVCGWWLPDAAERAGKEDQCCIEPGDVGLLFSGRLPVPNHVNHAVLSCWFSLAPFVASFS